MKNSLALFLVIVLALTIVGCSSPTPGAATSTRAITPVPIAQNTAPPPTRAGPTATATLSPNEFRNPVINLDFADPDILKVGETYYAYATNAGPTNIQLARSTDLVHWEFLGTALPALPLWSKPQAGLTWAPDVTTGSASNYIMYYTTRDAASDKQCIGVATAAGPEGPFRSTGTANEKALICQTEQGGSIDAATFTDDDGTRYLLWKNDGNCCGIPTHIYIQKLSADGMTPEGESTALIQNDLVWEGNLVEGPTLWKHDSKYYLFYSANAYNTERYAVGYAVADSILGPYQKSKTPILTSDMNKGAAFGPGGQDIILDKDGDTWIVYHSWDPTVSYRGVQIDPLVWDGDTPVVKGPSRMPQPLP